MLAKTPSFWKALSLLLQGLGQKSHNAVYDQAKVNIIIHGVIRIPFGLFFLEGCRKILRSICLYAQFQFIITRFLSKELKIYVKKKTIVRWPSEGTGNCWIKLFKSGPLALSA